MRDLEYYLHGYTLNIDLVQIRRGKFAQCTSQSSTSKKKHKNSKDKRVCFTSEAKLLQKNAKFKLLDLE